SVADPYVNVQRVYPRHDAREEHSRTGTETEPGHLDFEDPRTARCQLASLCQLSLKGCLQPPRAVRLVETALGAHRGRYAHDDASAVRPRLPARQRLLARRVPRTADRRRSKPSDEEDRTQPTRYPQRRRPHSLALLSPAIRRPRRGIDHPDRRLN